MSFVLTVVYNCNEQDEDVHGDIEVIVGKPVRESETRLDTGVVEMQFDIESLGEATKARRNITKNLMGVRTHVREAGACSD